MDEDSLQLCDWNATADLELVSLNLWCNMKESNIAQMLLNLMELPEFRIVTELTVTDSPGVGPGFEFSVGKKLTERAREVGDHPNVARFNIRDYLGGQTGDTAQTGHFRAKLAKWHEWGIFGPNRCAIAHVSRVGLRPSPRFRGLARGSSLLRVKYRSGCAREAEDRPSVGRLGGRCHLGGQTGETAQTEHFQPKSNVSEDTDDMFDDLLKKHGKVVYKRNDQKTASEEIDDDAESLSFAMAVAKVASDVKAGDIKVLFVKPLVYWTRFFIIATAFSRPQIDAIGTRIRDMAEEQYGKVASGDSKPNSWTLLDFGDVVVHIFLPQQREYYNLEEFYGNAASIELPFENQQKLRGSSGY
ncbi:Protein Iojap, chloroplastic [Capsicum annuum]|nr:Protein Iojap, chloroplastic [Capsicum annuum]